MKRCKNNIVRIIFAVIIFLNFSILYSAEIRDDDFISELLSLSMIDDDSKRLVEIELLYDKSSLYQRFILLPFAAKESMSQGRFTAAKEYTDELFELSERYSNDWNYGNAIHDANVVAGMLALNSDSVEKAIYHLIEAGKTPGSPQLNTYGPNMMLALALLERDEKESVIQYLNLCKSFWKRDNGRLDSWIASIRGGGIPYFGDNLNL